MKKFVFIICSIILAIVLLSCNKDSTNEDYYCNKDSTNEDYYYIKYQITGKVYFYIDEVTYNTENGSRSESFAAAHSFDQICGPVDKGFIASIKLTGCRGVPATNAVNIYVSKNNGPFAIKAIGQYSATYTIDF